MAKKTSLEAKREYARVLYLNGETARSAAEKAGVTQATLGKWVKDGGWRALRAASNITRPELVNKLLLGINKILDDVNESDNPADLAGLGDKLSKFAAVIEKLDKKANVVDVIEVFMAFSKWLQYRMTIDQAITPELIKAITKYQDLYISEQLTQKS
jgi:hypothetical protein